MLDQGHCIQVGDSSISDNPAEDSRVSNICAGNKGVEKFRREATEFAEPVKESNWKNSGIKFLGIYLQLLKSDESLLRRHMSGRVGHICFGESRYGQPSVLL